MRILSTERLGMVVTRRYQGPCVLRRESPVAVGRVMEDDAAHYVRELSRVTPCHAHRYAAS